jgi:hypothetical protein
MIDIENALFDKLANLLETEFSELADNVYSEIPNEISSFPLVVITEVSNLNYIRGQDNNEFENYATIAYDVNIYSNKISGAKLECKAILNKLDIMFLNYNFRRINYIPFKNNDDNVYRLTARYQAVVSNDYRLYSR